MHIEFRHLRSVRAIHQAGGLARAAEMLNVTQSALSHQIKGLEEQAGVNAKGGTMRLGASLCRVKAHTKAFSAYQRHEIHERHRHRYEVNNAFREQFVTGGLVVSGTYDPGDLVEIIELKDHPWFLAGQFHPEFKSRPLAPHPLFRLFVAAGLQHAGARGTGHGARASQTPAARRIAKTKRKTR